MSPQCRSRFSTHDGQDVRIVVLFPSPHKRALCAGCRRAAEAMGFDVRTVAA